MAYPFTHPKPKFWVDAATVNSLGTLEFRDPVSNALLDTYPTADDADADTNSSGGIITLDADGQAPQGIFLRDGLVVKCIIKDSAGATVDTVDDIRTPKCEVISVTDYNVLGDGTDETTKIQAAIDAAEAIITGGATNAAVVHFPAGEYVISSALTITENGVGIKGDGKFNSIIRSISDGGTTPHHDLVYFNGGAGGDAQRSNFLRDIQLRHNDNTVDGGSGVHFRNCNAPYMHDVQFWKMFQPIHIDNVVLGRFSFLDFTPGARTVVGGSCVLLESQADQTGKNAGNHFNGLEMTGSGLGGGVPSYTHMFHVRSSDGLYVQQTHSSGVGSAMEFAPDNTANNEVLDVMVSDYYDDSCTAEGFLWTGTSLADLYQGFYFSNCFSRNSESHGFHFNATTTTIKDVVIQGGRVKLNDLSGIKSSTDVEGLKINGTIFRDNNQLNSANQGDIEVGGDNISITGTEHFGGGALGACITMQPGSTNYSVIYPQFTGSSAADGFVDSADGNGATLVGITRVPNSTYSFGTEYRTIQSTDASGDNLWNYGLADDESMTLEVLIHAVDTTVAEVASYHLVGGAYKDGASAAALIGTTSQVHVGEVTGTMDATIDLNGDTMRIRVTGIAATTIEWGAQIKFVKRQV